MIIFDNDEEGYLRWICDNPKGFVINASKGGGNDLSYAKLHKADCYFISTDKITNYTTTTYYKVCSRDKQELVNWGHTHSSKFDECKICKP